MRSALFVPGDSERKLAKGLESRADALFVDLEDSVAPDNKQRARDVTQGFLRELGEQGDQPAIFVRVNAFDTGVTNDDLSSVLPARPDGIVLPKSEHGQDVVKLDSEIGRHETENNVDIGSIGIVAIITETALGTLNAGTYRRSSKRLQAVSWGAEDLSADLGALRRRYDSGRYRDVFRYARLQTILGAAAAGVQALDTVYPDFRDEAGMRKECEEAAIDGFTGKMAIHPAQVPIINELFTPSNEELTKARTIVDAFEAAGNPGVLALDGQMLDRPHLRKAKNLLLRAERKPRQ